MLLSRNTRLRRSSERKEEELKERKRENEIELRERDKEMERELKLSLAKQEYEKEITLRKLKLDSRESSVKQSLSGDTTPPLTSTPIASSPAIPATA